MEKHSFELSFDRMCTGMVLLVSGVGTCAIVAGGISILLLLR
jgi:hypothetical protein